MYKDNHNFTPENTKESIETSFDSIAEERKFAERVKEEVFYAGIFVDREELYDRAPAHLKNTIEGPHVTTNFAPSEAQLHLDELGSKAKIFAIGYGNDGKNEGLLVKIEADDPAIQKAVDALKVPHITLSYSDDSHPMYTSNLSFAPLEEPFELDGKYCLHFKGPSGEGDGPLVDNLEELKATI